MANATRRKPGGDFLQVIDEDRFYKPYKDLYSPHKVIVWFIDTVKKFRSDGEMTNTVILHKQFNWGLLWLLLGVMVQYITGLL